jgi:hypothetical protein
LVPVIVTVAPIDPETGDRLVILGPGTTVKFIPLLATPLALTTTFPVVAAVGTVTTTFVAIQLVTGATVPLKVTVPLPWLAPKLVPFTVTDTPGAPLVIERLVMWGAATTVKFTPLLLTPAA